MICEKCPACGLVLVNHDEIMIKNCVAFMGTTLNELGFKYLQDKEYLE